ncbi:pyridoxal phosphate-dependent transferase [Nitzschia inconspicua]|uniref:Pyridoxal phosphate-dependent transferase n=1 Tax=Nitzschia inconspicua TaxID=303405 RepID=A0A9K3M6R5_9STRA|nr:pyridoxal phosphate-dependent transferase [Nitzschia inconspicua]
MKSSLLQLGVIHHRIGVVPVVHALSTIRQTHRTIATLSTRYYQQKRCASRSGITTSSSILRSSLSSSSSNCNDTTTDGLAHRLDGLDQPTVWQEFSPLATQYNSINLGQGFPDWDPPHFVIEAMKRSIDPTFGRNANQYARSYAHMPLATVLAQEYTHRWQQSKLPSHLLPLDPTTQIATATGVTNVLYCALQGLINPGDQVVLLEPYFDIYSSQVQMAGGECVYCPLRPDTSAVGASDVFTLDLDELESKLSTQTRVLILNTPHNPTGKMFNRKELQGIANIVSNYPQLVVISDEVYEHIVFDTVNEPHLSIATINNGQIWHQTLTMSSAGKTFSCTGWKVGWAVGPSHLVKAVTSVQQWCNFSPTTPTQDAIAQALQIAREEPYQGYPTYYDWLASDYRHKRQLLVDALLVAGMKPIVPNGGFFIMADTQHVDFPYDDIANTQLSTAMPGYATGKKMPRDWALSRWLTQTVGVTAIPPSAFYSLDTVDLAANTLRFAFCKGESTLQQAKQRFETYFS